MRPEDLFQSPNLLAPHYRAFRVSERLLLTGHSHQAWPDCARAGQLEAWDDAAALVDEKWERAFAKAERVRRGFADLLEDAERSTPWRPTPTTSRTRSATCWPASAKVPAGLT